MLDNCKRRSPRQPPNADDATQPPIPQLLSSIIGRAAKWPVTFAKRNYDRTSQWRATWKTCMHRSVRNGSRAPNAIKPFRRPAISVRTNVCTRKAKRLCARIADGDSINCIIWMSTRIGIPAKNRINATCASKHLAGRHRWRLIRVCTAVKSRMCARLMSVAARTCLASIWSDIGLACTEFIRRSMSVRYVRGCFRRINCWRSIWNRIRRRLLAEVWINPKQEGEAERRNEKKIKEIDAMNT